jgi:hypothetical protein
MFLQGGCPGQERVVALSEKKGQVSALTVSVCVTDRVHHGFRNSVSDSYVQDC